eukprot:754509-Amphidinium_carterae.1
MPRNRRKSPSPADDEYYSAPNPHKSYEYEYYTPSPSPRPRRGRLSLNACKCLQFHASWLHWRCYDRREGQRQKRGGIGRTLSECGSAALRSHSFCRTWRQPHERPQQGAHGRPLKSFTRPEVFLKSTRRPLLARILLKGFPDVHALVLHWCHRIRLTNTPNPGSVKSLRQLSCVSCPMGVRECLRLRAGRRCTTPRSLPSLDVHTMGFDPKRSVGAHFSAVTLLMFTKTILQLERRTIKTDI